MLSKMRNDILGLPCAFPRYRVFRFCLACTPSIEKRSPLVSGL
jgi:hypothetical protein